MNVLLTNFEKSVMEKLLFGLHPCLENLRTQLAHCRAIKREFTGVGFFIFFDIDPKLAYGDVNFQLGDIHAKVAGVRDGVGFVLFIEKGLINNLEGYTYDEPYPKKIEQYTLNYSWSRAHRPLTVADLEKNHERVEVANERDFIELFTIFSKIGIKDGIPTKP